MSSLVTNRATTGTLRASIRLSDRQKIHYGPNDPITGRVILYYQPSSSLSTTELFAPVNISLLLTGKLKAMYTSPPSHDEINGTTLVSTHHLVHSGPFRAPANTEVSLPFSINFPPETVPTSNTGYRSIQRSDGRLYFDNHTVLSPPAPLPPSLVSYPRSTPDLELYGSTISYNLHNSITIIYSLSLSVSIPGLSSILVGTPAVDPEVLYDAPRSPLALAAVQAQTGSAKTTLYVVDETPPPPEDEAAKPRGLRGKAKALLNSSPSSQKPQTPFIFEYLHIPMHLYISQPLTFTLGISYPADDDNHNQTPPRPEVHLTSITVSLLSRTFAAADTIVPGFSQPRTIINTSSVKEKTADFQPDGPFTKANNYRKEVDVGKLTHVSSSFKYAGVRREYSLKVEVKLQVGSQTVITRREFNVEVHPEVEVEDVPSSGIMEAGSSMAGLRNEFTTLSIEDRQGDGHDLAPPSYDEVFDMSRSSGNTAVTSSFTAANKSTGGDWEGEWLYASDQTGWRPGVVDRHGRRAAMRASGSGRAAYSHRGATAAASAGSAAGMAWGGVV